MAAKGVEDVLVRRAPTQDRLGDPVPGEVVGILENCIVWPRSTSENADRGRVTIEGQNVWVPAPVSIVPKASDVVEIRGEMHNIDGAVGDWRKKTGKRKGLLFATTRYTG